MLFLENQQGPHSFWQKHLVCLVSEWTKLPTTPTNLHGFLKPDISKIAPFAIIPIGLLYLVNFGDWRLAHINHNWKSRGHPLMQTLNLCFLRLGRWTLRDNAFHHGINITSLFPICNYPDSFPNTTALCPLSSASQNKVSTPGENITYKSDKKGNR